MIVTVSILTMLTIFAFYFIYYLFIYATPHSMWDLSSPAKPVPPAVGAWSLNHWTAREVLLFLKNLFIK